MTSVREPDIASYLVLAAISVYICVLCATAWYQNCRIMTILF